MSEMQTSVSARLDALATALKASGAADPLSQEAARLAELVRDTDDLLRIAEVRRRTGLSESEIYRQEAAGCFPTPRKLAGRQVAWYSSDITAWIRSRPPRERLVGAA